MEYTVEKIIELVNAELDMGIENGEQLYKYIMFQNDLYVRTYMENSDLIDELIRHKDELYYYRQRYGKAS